MVPIGELSAVDTAFLELVPSPLAEVADASPVTVASGSEPVCPPLPSVPSAPGVPASDRGACARCGEERDSGAYRASWIY